LAVPTEVPIDNHSRRLDRQTSLSAHIEAKGVSGALATRRRPAKDTETVPFTRSLARTLSVYDGHIRIGSLIETAGGWLAHDNAGRSRGCHRRQIDAARAL